MTENLYLAHHGVVGQKWGVRRYQNRDGSLTKAGRKHRGLNPTPRKIDPIKSAKAAGKAAQIKAKNDAKLAVAKAKEDAKLAKIKAKQDAEIAAIREKSKTPQQKALEKIQAEQKYGKTTFKNLDKMSDQELQAAINRLRMEDQFRQLMGVTVPIDKKMARPQTTQEKLKNGASDAAVIGSEMVKRAFVTAGQEKMTDLMRYAMTKGINSLVQDEAISKDNGNKKQFLANKEWAKSGFSRDYDPKNGKLNKYSDAFDDGKTRSGSTLYGLMASGKLTANSLSSKELKVLVDYTKDLSNVRSNTDSYTGKNGKKGGMSESQVRDLVLEILDENKG